MTKRSKSEGARLKDIRMALSLSQRELAKEFGVSGSAIALWESGTNPIPGPAIKLLELYEEYLSEDLAEGRMAHDIRELSSTWTARILQSFYGARSKAPPHLKAQLEIGFQNMLKAQTVGGMIKYRIRRAALEKAMSSISQAKGLAMKIAQAALYIDPGLDVDLRTAIQSLQLVTRPMAPTVAARVIFEELGESPLKLFKKWEPRPFATASIGQVHRAQLHSGEQVAVKIQYPGVRKSLETDFKNFGILNAIASFMKRSSMELLKEIGTIVINECDFEKEAKAQEEAAEIFARDPDIRIPQVHWPLSGKRVLTMEYLDGDRFSDFIKDASPETRRRVARALWRFETACIQHGMMNSDSHESNFVLFKDGTLGCLDFGRTVYWDKQLSEVQNQFVLAFAKQDKEAALRAFRKMNWVKDWASFDFDEFWDMMKRQQAHCIAGRPFRFTPEYIKQSMEEGRSYKGAKNLNLTTTVVFGMAESFGLWSLLSQLGVEDDWGQMTVDILSSPTKHF